eukprot:TRINITY_DN959_c0_g1_i10.p1 TRINITY_DN959_c0_g1~~TRINITY_DN959_c0_g1_i10.p1  ORF type:complete len:297 (-),score=54.57 TRINITY_DN959_c0_g1_i10:538-1350(-)
MDAKVQEDIGVVTVIAVPFYQDTVLFLPCPRHLIYNFEGKQEVDVGDQEAGQSDAAPLLEGQESSTKIGHVLPRKGIKGWWDKRRRQRWDRESKSDKFLKRLPEGVQHLQILYPQSLGIRNITQQLAHQVGKSVTRRSRLGVAYVAALPFAIILDLLTLTFIFTITDVALIVSNSSKMNKGRLVEDLIRRGLLSFVPNTDLDRLYHQIHSTAFGMPDNLMIDELCDSLNVKHLAKTIRKVRNSKAHRLNINRDVFEESKEDEGPPKYGES